MLIWYVRHEQGHCLLLSWLLPFVQMFLLGGPRRRRSRPSPVTRYGRKKGGAVKVGEAARKGLTLTRRRFRHCVGRDGRKVGGCPAFGCQFSLDSELSFSSSAWISDAFHTVVRGPSFMGFGYLPFLHPAHQALRLTGIRARTCGNRSSALSMLFCIIPPVKDFQRSIFMNFTASFCPSLLYA